MGLEDQAGPPAEAGDVVLSSDDDEVSNDGGLHARNLVVDAEVRKAE